MSKQIEPQVNTAFESTIDKPEELTDLIHIHGEQMTLEEAELKGMIRVERDKNGKPKANGEGVIKYTKVTS